MAPSRSGLETKPAMQDVLDYGQPVHEVVVLKDHADLAAQFLEILLLELADRVPFEVNLAARDLDHSVDAAQQRRLACAGRTDHGNKLALLDRKADVVQCRRGPAIGFADALDFKQDWVGWR